MTNRPLITFALFAYNQEKFIRNAVEGALAQTYFPLEIILSDDGSADNTFQIMQSMIDDYHGPHKVKLNRNEQNLGIGKHVKRVSDLATGEIVVMAAGDDISTPIRTQALADIFLADSETYAVFSDIALINEDGQLIENRVEKWIKDKPVTRIEITKNCGGVATGASYAYRRECFFWPWDYPDFLMNEDRVLPFRACMLGKVTYLDRALVYYRLSCTGVSRALPPNQVMAKLKKNHIDELLSTLDFSKKKGLISSADAYVLRRILKELKTFSPAILFFRSLDNCTGRLAIRLLENWLHRDTLIPRLFGKLQKGGTNSSIKR